MLKHRGSAPPARSRGASMHTHTCASHTRICAHAHTCARRCRAKDGSCPGDPRLPACISSPATLMCESNFKYSPKVRRPARKWYNDVRPAHLKVFSALLLGEARKFKTCTHQWARLAVWRQLIANVGVLQGYVELHNGTRGDSRVRTCMLRN